MDDNDDEFSYSYMILYGYMFLSWSYELNQSSSIIEQACGGKESDTYALVKESNQMKLSICTYVCVFMMCLFIFFSFYQKHIDKR